MEIREDGEDRNFRKGEWKLLPECLFFYCEQDSDEYESEGERERKMTLVGVDIEVPECGNRAITPWRKRRKSLVINNISYRIR